MPVQTPSWQRHRSSTTNRDNSPAKQSVWISCGTAYARAMAGQGRDYVTLEQMLSPSSGGA